MARFDLSTGFSPLAGKELAGREVLLSLGGAGADSGLAVLTAGPLVGLKMRRPTPDSPSGSAQSCECRAEGTQCLGLRLREGLACAGGPTSPLPLVPKRSAHPSDPVLGAQRRQLPVPAASWVNPRQTSVCGYVMSPREEQEGNLLRGSEEPLPFWGAKLATQVKHLKRVCSLMQRLCSRELFLRASLEG